MNESVKHDKEREGSSEDNSTETEIHSEEVVARMMTWNGH